MGQLERQMEAVFADLGGLSADLYLIDGRTRVAQNCGESFLKKKSVQQALTNLDDRRFVPRKHTDGGDLATRAWDV